MPSTLLDSVALVGSESQVRKRIAEYGAAGIAEICLVPSASDLPSDRRTLATLSER